jgi:23S rRNA pseudouridine1911/1915/1917 synthase
VERSVVSQPQLDGSPASVQKQWPLVWEDYLRKVSDQAQAEVVPAETTGGKYARLSTGCLVDAAGLGLHLVQLETGRMHQIRIQAASRGMPILGDINYGSSHPFPPASPQSTGEGHPPMALHALRLEFRHPQSAKTISATAEVPLSWHALPTDLLSRVIEITERSRREADTCWKWETLRN